MNAMIASTPCDTLPMPARTRSVDATPAADALMRLQGLERVVLSLFYKETLSLGAIAVVLEMSEREVTQIHAQAMARLRAELVPAHRHAA